MRVGYEMNGVRCFVMWDDFFKVFVGAKMGDDYCEKIAGSPDRGDNLRCMLWAR